MKTKNNIKKKNTFFSKKKRHFPSFFFLFLLFFLCFYSLRAEAFLFWTKTNFIRIYPKDQKGNWLRVKNSLGKADLSSEAEKSVFNEKNSAIYKGGQKEIIFSRFLQTENEIIDKTEDDEIIEKIQGKEKGGNEGRVEVDNGKMEEGEGQVETKTDEKNIDNSVGDENLIQTEELKNSENVDKQGEKSDGKDKQGERLNFLDQENFFDIIRQKKVKAKEILTFDELKDQKFAGAKIFFSLAAEKDKEITEKKKENIPIERENENDEKKVEETKNDIKDENIQKEINFTKNNKKEIGKYSFLNGGFLKRIFEKGQLFSGINFLKDFTESFFRKTVDNVFAYNPSEISNKDEQFIEETISNETENTVINIDANIIIWASLDGKEWSKLGEITQENTSNKTNNGYFNYNLLLVQNWDDFENLQIKLEGIVNEETKITYYLDSLWVEAEYKEEEKEIKSRDLELHSIKNDWKSSEEPIFEIQKKNQSFLEKGISFLFSSRVFGFVDCCFISNFIY